MPAHADVVANPAAARGFYGGVSLRDAGSEGVGVSFGSATSVWNRYTAPTIDDTATRSLLFGGFRWSNDVGQPDGWTPKNYACRASRRIPSAIHMRNCVW